MIQYSNLVNSVDKYGHQGTIIGHNLAYTMDGKIQLSYSFVFLIASLLLHKRSSEHYS